MKKKLLFVVMFLVSISTVMAAVPKSPSEATSIEEYKASLANIDQNSRKYAFKMLTEIQPVFEYQLNKDFNNVTYAQFKAQALEILKKNNVKESDLLLRFMNCFNFRNVRSFPHLCTGLVLDPEFKTYARNTSFYRTIVPKYAKYITNGEQLRDLLVEGFNRAYTIKDADGLKIVSNLLDTYGKNVSKFKNEQIIEDMKNVKKLYYTKIASNEAWKPVLVKVELILKSVQ